MKDYDEWMLVTKSHVEKIHSINNENLDWAKEHLIDHLINKYTHKHYTSDLRVSVK